MENKLDTFFYSADSKAFVSYDIPKDSIIKKFDFSRAVSEVSVRNAISSKKIFAIIDVIHDDYVVLACLVDQSKGVIQRRKFDKEPLQNVLELFEGEGIEILINTYAGKREFIYTKSKDAKDLFEEPEDLFTKHKGSSFFPTK